MLTQFKSELSSLVGSNYASKRYLIATSGGADSLVLAHLCNEAGLSGEIVHCNFNLRGQESDEDQAFVELFAKQLDIPYHIKSFDTQAYTLENKVGTQVAARELRYHWFEELRQEIKADFVLIGHHKNDVIETFFINLFRGTGLKGLTGIKATNKNILRPLLQVDKEQILRYAVLQKINYREDSSNMSDKYMRNKIRMELLPMIEQIRTGALNKISDEIDYLNQAWEELNVVVLKEKERCVTIADDIMLVHKSEVEKLSNPTYYLFEWLRDFGFNATQVNNIWETKQPGTMVTSSTHQLLNDRSDLIISPIKRNNIEPILVQEIPFQNNVIKGSFISKLEVNFDVSNKNGFFDVEKLSLPLTIRLWQVGDSIKPFGMKGKKKKVSDILIDAKVDALEKARVVVLHDATGEIIWLPKHCVSMSALIDNSSEKIVLLEIV
jgi:tRNA(Ile)-lysidine synthase